MRENINEALERIPAVSSVTLVNTFGLEYLIIDMRGSLILHDTLKRIESICNSFDFKLFSIEIQLEHLQIVFTKGD